MAKLLREFVSFQDIEVLEEDVIVEGKKPQKHYKLKGPFLEAEIKNKNGRIYPQELIVREVNTFVIEKIGKNRAVGECDHPDSPQINLDRISHVIESLVMEKNLGIGVARIIDTPKGRILETLVKEGILLGMSTRGVGSLEEETVKDDFNLITIDAVLDQSAPAAVVEGVLENKEYIIGADGEITEVLARAYETLEAKVKKRYSRNTVSKNGLHYLMDFLQDIQTKKINDLR